MSCSLHMSCSLQVFLRKQHIQHHPSRKHNPRQFQPRRCGKGHKCHSNQCDVLFAYVMFVAHVMFVAGFLTETAHTTPSKPETKPTPISTAHHLSRKQNPRGKGHKIQIPKNIPTNVTLDVTLAGIKSQCFFLNSS